MEEVTEWGKHGGQEPSEEVAMGVRAKGLWLECGNGEGQVLTAL